MKPRRKEKENGSNTTLMSSQQEEGGGRTNHPVAYGAMTSRTDGNFTSIGVGIPAGLARHAKSATNRDDGCVDGVERRSEDDASFDFWARATWQAKGKMEMTCQGNGWPACKSLHI
jgi:hypothetical protein